MDLFVSGAAGMHTALLWLNPQQADENRMENHGSSYECNISMVFRLIAQSYNKQSQCICLFSW